MSIMEKLLRHFGFLSTKEVNEKSHRELRDAVHEYRNTVMKSVAHSRQARHSSQEALKTAESAIKVLEESQGRDGVMRVEEP